jgi:hypothetical protein
MELVKLIMTAFHKNQLRRSLESIKKKHQKKGKALEFSLSDSAASASLQLAPIAFRDL